MKHTKQTSVIASPKQFLEYWRGHRRLTRRVIDTFPENELFRHSIGGMRPFADMARELIGMAGRGIHGIAKGDWNALGELDYHDEKSTLSALDSKDELLRFWDKATTEIDALWPQIPPERFQEVDSAWGEYENEIWSHLFYFVDNEIHHRGQGFVYLRSLGIQPPYFWER